MTKALVNLIASAAKSDDAKERSGQAAKVSKTAIDVGKKLSEGNTISEIDNNLFHTVKVAVALNSSLIAVRRRLCA